MSDAECEPPGPDTVRSARLPLAAQNSALPLAATWRTTPATTSVPDVALTEVHSKRRGAWFAIAQITPPGPGATVKPVIVGTTGGCVFVGAVVTGTVVVVTGGFAVVAGTTEVVGAKEVAGTEVGCELVEVTTAGDGAVVVGGSAPPPVDGGGTGTAPPGTPPPAGASGPPPPGGATG